MLRKGKSEPLPKQNSLSDTIVTSHENPKPWSETSISSIKVESSTTCIVGGMVFSGCFPDSDVCLSLTQMSNGVKESEE